MLINTFKKWIPNCITLGNLTCGMLACYMAVSQNLINSDANPMVEGFKNWSYLAPAILIFCAALLDFFDGLAARLLNVHSELGKQLDSLADMVSFGVAPSFIILSYNLAGNYLFSFSGLLIGLFACIRLAKFNIDTRQSNSFLGLPVPSVGLIIASLLFIDSTSSLSFLIKPAMVLSLILLLCILMVSELPLLALKFKTYGLKGNLGRYLVLGLGLTLFICFQFQGIPLIILGYVLVSLFVKEKIKPSSV